MLNFWTVLPLELIGSDRVHPQFELHMIEEGVAPISPDRVLKYCKTVLQIIHLYTGGGPGSSSATSYFSEDFLRGQFFAV
jgi:hypothetical protein